MVPCEHRIQRAGSRPGKSPSAEEQGRHAAQYDDERREFPLMELPIDNHLCKREDSDRQWKHFERRPVPQIAEPLEVHRYGHRREREADDENLQEPGQHKNLPCPLARLGNCHGSSTPGRRRRRALVHVHVLVLAAALPSQGHVRSSARVRYARRRWPFHETRVRQGRCPVSAYRNTMFKPRSARWVCRIRCISGQNNHFTIRGARGTAGPVSSRSAEGTGQPLEHRATTYPFQHA